MPTEHTEIHYITDKRRIFPSKSVPFKACSTVQDGTNCMYDFRCAGDKFSWQSALRVDDNGYGPAGTARLHHKHARRLLARLEFEDARPPRRKGAGGCLVIVWGENGEMISLHAFLNTTASLVQEQAPETSNYQKLRFCMVR